MLRDQHHRIEHDQAVRHGKRAMPAASITRSLRPLEPFCYITEKSFLTSVKPSSSGPYPQRLPAVEENATNDRQRHDEVCLVMGVGGAAIGIICKAPQPGRSKTRLAQAIGVAAASELSACFLRDVAAAIEAVPETLGRRGYGVYAPAGTEDIMRQLLPPGFGLLLQAGDDLGHVLIGATRAFLWPDMTASCSSMATARPCRPVCWRRRSRSCAARRPRWCSGRQATAAITSSA